MRCHCNPKPEPIEFPISDSLKDKGIRGIPELFPINNNICELKLKIILEYLQIIDNLECGNLNNLEFLLEEISLIDIIENG